MRLSMIIVSWNVRNELLDCLRSIQQNPPSHRYEVIVVDNASTDGTADAVQEEFPDVTLIVNTENRGFAAANNVGIRKSQGEYVLILNPDTIIPSHSLDVLVTFMDTNKEVGASGPRLLNFDGTTQQSIHRFPSFRGALHRHTAFKFLGVFKREYKKWIMKDVTYDHQMDVDQVMGAALMTRRSLLDSVGLMDERFFMYYEEVDLCYRVKEAGWRIVYVPESTITHLGGCSSRQVPAGKHLMAMTSLLLFFKKHRGTLTTGAFACIFKPALVINDLIEILAGILKYTFAMVTLNERNREKALNKIRKAATLLVKYSWASLFRV